MLCVDKSHCVGCSACKSVCPVSAIEMQTNAEGFNYPHVDDGKCIKCGKCNAVCPVIGEPNFIEGTAYAVQHKNPDVLKNSASGGAFTAVSDEILDNNGVVYGSAFTDNLEVKHIRAENREVRDRMRGSKYIQSDMTNIYGEISADLKDGRKVLFVGTPCQVQAVKNFFDGNDLLYTCDLVCHGVPSPQVFREHLAFLSDKYNSKVVAYQCRPKRWGWHTHREIATLQDGREIFSTAYSDIWRELYYRRVITRPSCYTCKFSRLERVGDISIADCRNIERVGTDMDTFNGISLVFSNSPKGEKLLDSIRESCVIEALDVQKILQPPLCAPSGPAANRQEFWNTYSSKGYKGAIRQEFGRFYALKYQIKKLLGK